MSIEGWWGLAITVIATTIAILIGTRQSKRVGDSSIQQMQDHSREMVDSFSNTKKFIQQITGLFSASQMVGIETAYENRLVALQERDSGGKDVKSFLHYIKEDPKLIVVGSSLLGLKAHVPKLSQYLRSRSGLGHETKFLLTCPCYSNLREAQEKRLQGQICREIEEAVRFLKEDCCLNLDECVRFYKGTPTCFMIITSRAMLLNPYPYQTEAFKAFCLEVRRLETSPIQTDQEKLKKLLKGVTDWDRFESEITEVINKEGWDQYDYSVDAGPDIYGQFYWYHYFLPWFSREVVTYQQYDSVCRGKECPALKNGYTGVCNLLKEPHIIADTEIVEGDGKKDQVPELAQ
jgi:hypothetical protein